MRVLAAQVSRFLAQTAAPDAQLAMLGERVLLTDTVSGSAALLTPRDGGWEVREGGPVRLWERMERVLTAYDEAGRPEPEAFTLHMHDGAQQLRHPQMPSLPLPRP